MLNLPPVILLGIVFILLLFLKAARAWVLILALVFGVYLANTQIGKDTRKGGDSVVNTVNQQQSSKK